MTALARSETNHVKTLSSSGSASVRFSTLGAHTLSFIMGILVVLIGGNFFSDTTNSFSTPSLISFLFGIALSAASTVLAIAAISLGKASEQAMIDRSDASIRLQNEVFTKTTEALARIESSTGVTEKRIEDIISGRAGELSHAIADRLERAEGGRTKPRDVLEREIKESLIDELSATRAVQMKEREDSAKRTTTANNHYRTFQNDLLTTVANSGVGTCARLGDGSFVATGDDLFDAVVVVGTERVGISALSGHPLLRHRESAGKFVKAAVKEIAEGRIQRVLVGIVGEQPLDDKFLTQISSDLSYLKPELANKVTVVSGPTAKDTVGAVVDALKHTMSVPATLQLAGTDTGPKQGAA